MEFEFFNNANNQKARIKINNENHYTTMIFNSIADVKKNLGARSPTTKFVMNWTSNLDNVDGIVCVFDKDVKSRFVVIMTNEKVNYVISKEKGKLKIETQQQTEYATVSKSKTAKEEVRHVSEKEALVDRLANMHRRFTEVVRNNVRFDLYEDTVTEPTVKAVLAEQAKKMKELEELDLEMIEVIMNDEDTVEVEKKLQNIEKFAEDMYPLETVEPEEKPEIFLPVIEEVSPVMPDAEETPVMPNDETPKLEPVQTVKTITEEELRLLRVHNPMLYSIKKNQINCGELVVI
ncbi:hypothetical protein [Klebsiella pneumoniae]|uniref:hypothetical protein n=1 Tax=Klebsiella pneumoniae TaxID=573 RepID=UPI0013D01707|nr:hypothetical protein [Klebsiella pneumoniae]